MEELDLKFSDLKPDAPRKGIANFTELVKNVEAFCGRIFALDENGRILNADQVAAGLLKVGSNLAKRAGVRLEDWIAAAGMEYMKSPDKTIVQVEKPGIVLAK
jgi:hypothetical protein